MISFGTGRKLLLRSFNILLDFRATLTILLLLSMASCDLELLKPTLKVPFKTNFDFHIDSLGFKSDLVLIHEEIISVDIDSLIRHYDGNPELVKDAKIKSVTLTTLEPEDVELSFLESSSVTVSANTYEETIVAIADSDSLSANEVMYTLTEDAGEILQLLTSVDEFSVRIYGLFAAPIPVNTIGLRMKIEWEVSVAPF